MTMEVDTDRNMLVSYDEREIPYDLLVTVPVNMGADFVERSGLGDELNHVEVDKHTFLADNHDNMFAIGDAANMPDIEGGFGRALRRRRVRRELPGAHRRTADDRAFDGHANCFIESGNGKGLLIDFNYDVQPLPGKFPVPGVGPFSLLKETEPTTWASSASAGSTGTCSCRADRSR